MRQRTELTDRQRKAIELLARGENVSNTAKIIGANRKTVTEWKKTDIFKEELNRCIEKINSDIDETLKMNIKPMADRLVKIALTSKSEKTSLDAIIYSLNRLYGTPTKPQKEENEGTNTINVTIEDLLDEIDENNKVVNFPK